MTVSSSSRLACWVLEQPDANSVGNGYFIVGTYLGRLGGGAHLVVV